ncbi:hypothetical protein FDP41_000078 [Naegleria fowleri]|uniref:Uncharacterized protein n=1 Tax=Naegleria fowleri TaxID=5763 RepID=A0A6A5CIB7_NAEFO|nr:uncharacterized protein FDP41_000078 [Naegleria fowleri]KAF0985039.1 hypothetical protein FDP41_000078 [Naegleria fowleri]CAG4707885.1 unnamed protein product [Naegleria fowleri]
MRKVRSVTYRENESIEDSLQQVDGDDATQLNHHHHHDDSTYVLRKISSSNPSFSRNLLHDHKRNENATRKSSMRNKSSTSKHTSNVDSFLSSLGGGGSLSSNSNNSSRSATPDLLLTNSSSTNNTATILSPRYNKLSPLFIPQHSQSTTTMLHTSESSSSLYIASPLLPPSSSQPNKSIIDMEIEQLRLEIEDLKQIVESMMDESHSYTIKYTRRILIFSNTLISIYAVGRRLYDIIYSNKGTILNPFTYISIFKNRKSNGAGIGGDLPLNSKFFSNVEALNKYGITSKRQIGRMLLDRLSNGGKISSPLDSASRKIFSSSLPSTFYQSSSGRLANFVKNIRNSKQIYAPSSKASIRPKNVNRGEFLWRIFGLIWKEFLCAALLTLSSYWLMKSESYKRQIAVVLSLLANLYLALTTDISPWAIYFNFVSIFLYITAQYVKNTPESMEKVKMLASNLTKSLSISQTNIEEEVIDENLKDTCTVSATLNFEEKPITALSPTNITSTSPTYHHHDHMTD